MVAVCPEKFVKFSREVWLQKMHSDEASFVVFTMLSLCRLCPRHNIWTGGLSLSVGVGFACLVWGIDHCLQRKKEHYQQRVYLLATMAIGQ